MNDHPPRQNGSVRLAPSTGSAIDRLPPQNLEAEQGVLGSALLDNDVLDEVIPILKAEHFYRDNHALLYRTIRDLHDAGHPVDSITLEEELRRREDLEKVGGIDVISQILASVPHAANAVYYARIVREKATARDLIEASNETLREGYSNTFTADDLLARAEARVLAVRDDETLDEAVPIQGSIEALAEKMATRKPGEHEGVLFGYPALDEMIGGLRPGSLTVVAGRPSMGKTAFAINVATRVAWMPNQPVFFASMEMRTQELMERMILAEARVSGDRIKAGALARHEQEAIRQAAQDIKCISPFTIDDAPSQDMSRLGAVARRSKRKTGMVMMFVDYIQLIESDNNRDSRQEQVAKISRRLKMLAGELGVPIVALSQINRENEKREDRRPKMSDLRESGAIEQDADNVLLIHRPEYYDRDDRPGIAEIIVAKQRNGRNGVAELMFIKHLARFESIVDAPAGAGPQQQQEIY